MKFEWDPIKARTNQEKHGISFFEAATCFADEKGFVVLDSTHSSQRELRWFFLGKSANGRVLTVRYTRRGQQIRIIGAGAWRDGMRLYKQHNNEE